MHRLRNVDFPAVDRRKKCTNVKGHVYGGPVSSNALKLQQIEKGCKNNRRTEKNIAVKVHKEKREKCFGETKQLQE